ncbi:S26 family signal peptidase [Curtobacterium sp. Leaf261]|uniref:S26 family signal peptidase n=1 Tax=Curtobacterium sp. Leaf261 TaxID=1736311 RepID=UPI0006FDA520|nr:S26 family signal peptidase [Curtobacterium sp. Leaf261]KQO64299.1 hypothetical protein ASF23_17215 [Curtobacterium sp. Leaf261]
MSQITAIPLTGTLDRPALVGTTPRPFQAALSWSVAVAAAVCLAATLLLLHAGGRIFVVETPSMGEAAPVGTLIIDMPVNHTSLRVGDIVSFQVPANPSVVYTHRIIAIDAAGGIHTRGDVNGATDPWTLTQDNLVGAPAALIPHLGWLFRAIPILLIGNMLIWVLTSPFSDRVTRSSLRVAGAATTAAYAAFLLKPFVHVTTIANTATVRNVDATVISSGIFPVHVSARGGNSIHLVDGQVGHLAIHELTRNGQYQITSTIDLDVAGWVALITICLIPLIWCLAIGRRTVVRPA